jgi:hypothetical protein
VTVYLGTPPTFAQRLAAVCEIISCAPSGSVERATLHGAYAMARAARGAAELAAALSELADVAAGRDVPVERFAEITASALEISAARDRRAATRATPRTAAPRRGRSPRTRRMVLA